MPPANVIELRQLLSEKFPGLRTRIDDPAGPDTPRWPTGLPQLDAPLQGGLRRGALTELIAEHPGTGSASIILSIIRQALAQQHFIAVVDGQDSLDVTHIGHDLSRLLWVRCSSATESLKTADLLLRDANLPVIVLDLATTPPAQLRGIPSSTWHRFQRIIEHTSAVCLVATPRPIVGTARTRILLRSRLSLASLDCTPAELLRHLKFDVTEPRRGQLLEALPRSA